MSKLSVNNFNSNIYVRSNQGQRYQSFGASPVFQTNNINQVQQNKKTDDNDWLKWGIGIAVATAIGITAYVLTKGKNKKGIQNAAGQMSGHANPKPVTETPKLLASKEEIPERFSPILGKDIGANHLTGENEIYFYAKGNVARPTLHENSLFSEFAQVPRLSDEIVLQRIEKAKREVIDEFGASALSSWRKNVLGRTFSLESLNKQNPINTIYDAIRYSNYTEAQTIGNATKQYRDIIRTNISGMSHEIRDGGTWYYRHPANLIDSNSKCRISLNARVDEQLISELDNYLLANNIPAKYKMSSSLEGACTRPDTYTIYFNEEITPKIKEDISRIAKPYIRQGQKTYPVGEQIDEGIFYVKECNQTDVRDAVKIASAINPKVKNILDDAQVKWLVESKSAGEIEAVKIFLRKLLAE